MVYIEDGESVPRCPRCNTLLKFILKIEDTASLLRWDYGNEVYARVDDEKNQYNKVLFKCESCGYMIKMKTLKFVKEHLDG